MPQFPYPFYQVKRIFLACPGDLVAERSRFPKLIETVNNLRAHSVGLHLEPIGWERVIPSVGRPQDLINEELKIADLVVVLFWNRIGSLASNNTTQTGTLEEFELAMKLYSELERPLVWVYFRKPTAEPDGQLEGVLRFRKSLEEGRDVFFRIYKNVEDWEEMFRQHLVALLDGMERWSIDSNFEYMRPDRALMKGRFLGEGIYRYGTKLRLSVDLDGCGNSETVSFWYSHGAHNLTVAKFDKGFHLALPPWEDFLESAKVIHLAVKDVTNDGLPEILLAAHDGVIDLRLAVWGLTPEGHEYRNLDGSEFKLLNELTGQSVAYVFEGGTIQLPYGSAGLAKTCKWVGDKFACED